MYKTFFACPKNEVPKVAHVHPCTRDIRASCTSKKDIPDIKASNKTLGLPLVIPVFDYMDVVGRATQEAKAESRT